MTLSRVFSFSFVDSCGVPLDGGKMYVYKADSPTQQAVTYKDPDGETLNTNPIILNSRGCADIYIESDKSYNFLVINPQTDRVEWDVKKYSCASGGGGEGGGGISAVTASVDSAVGTPSVEVSLEDTILNLAFHNLKGVTGEKGATGDKGEKGDKGDTGLTGSTGATGATGAKGDKGDQGERGIQGEKGDKGDKGKSAYEVAVDEGYVGTKTQWIASLKGEKGDKGDKGDTGEQGAKGDKGDDGADAYKIGKSYFSGYDKDASSMQTFPLEYTMYSIAKPDSYSSTTDVDVNGTPTFRLSKGLWLLSGSFGVQTTSSVNSWIDFCLSIAKNPYSFSDVVKSFAYTTIKIDGTSPNTFFYGNFTKFLSSNDEQFRLVCFADHPSIKFRWDKLDIYKLSE